VGGGDDVAAARGGELGRALVAERAGAGLETGAAESTPQADDMERHPGRLAAARDDLAVPIGVGAAGAVVDMQGREAQLQAEARVDARQQGEKRHRVGAAGQHQQHVLSGAKHVLPLHEAGHAPLEAEACRIGPGHGSPSEGDDLVAASRRSGEVMDGLGANAGDDVVLREAASGTAGAAARHVHGSVEEAHQHLLERGVGAAGVLPGARRVHGVAHEEDLDVFVAQDKRLGETEGVVRPFAAVGGRVDDDQHRHDASSRAVLTASLRDPAEHSRRAFGDKNARAYSAAAWWPVLRLDPTYL